MKAIICCLPLLFATPSISEAQCPCGCQVTGVCDCKDCCQPGATVRTWSGRQVQWDKGYWWHKDAAGNWWYCLPGATSMTLWQTPEPQLAVPVATYYPNPVHTFYGGNGRFGRTGARGCSGGSCR